MVDVLQKIGRDHVRRHLTPQHFEVCRLILVHFSLEVPDVRIRTSDCLESDPQQVYIYRFTSITEFERHHLAAVGDGVGRGMER
ncbi:hypothetical protein RvY_04003-1 [Ramazzottius varieornatus]|uniref:Uncharacterized protein n=1 Tax=Ramazzottius varieornatus TaxID=947166 RepID=A0A1D1UX29_RAMVA|nr:hypothetical protein RvY_04003-1 [Ramazzottius varieornatus]